MKNSLLTRSLGIGALFFATILNAQNSESLIRDYISKEASFKGMQNPLEFKILNEVNSASMQSNIVNVQQYYQGVPIYMSLAKAVIKDGNVLSFNNNFEKKYSPSTYSNVSTVKSALDTVLVTLGLTASQYTLLADGQEINNPAKNEVASFQYYYKDSNNKLVPARLFYIDDSANNAFWSVLTNLENNQIIEKHNMVISCNFYDDAYAATESGNAHNHDHFISNFTENQINEAISSAKLATDATYNVFKLPVEAPTFGTRSMVTSPWDLTASPLGWHDSGLGTYTYTRGNNAYAYFDNAGNNTVPNTDKTDGGVSLTFDFPYAEAPDISAYYNKHAAITNLFYMNNMMHDIFYKFGFNEAAGNFQTNNFSNGGKGNDAVLAEGFDGSGYNNANFTPGYENSAIAVAPRMQMYLWKSGTLGLKQKLFYNAPADAVTRPGVNSGSANFGQPLMSIPASGDVMIPSDPTGCSTITSGTLVNKIALLSYKSGDCAFNIKVKNAQNAGAIGAIVHRTTSNTTIDMNNTTNGTTGITIKSIMLGKDEGDYILSQIANGVTVNVDLKDMGNGYKNSSLDNGVIAHEYGHGISNRMTGSGVGCLNNAEQMGEGWSDFFALMLTNKPDYTSSTARGMATYSNGQAPTGSGIRSKKYSTDLAVNNYTYNSINNAFSPHDVGQVWATLLWDLSWKMADKYGYSSDIVANPNSGSAKTVQLVMDGLALQPCSPDFVTGRDAILEADALKGGADECIIWNVFARRGVGLNANAGSNNNVNDQTEDYTVPEKCKLATSEVSKNKAYSVYPNPAKGEFFIAGKPTLSTASVKVEILDASGKLVKSFERKKNAVESISTKGMAKGLYVVSITEGGKVVQADKLIVE